MLPPLSPSSSGPPRPCGHVPDAAPYSCALRTPCRPERQLAVLLNIGFGVDDFHLPSSGSSFSSLLPSSGRTLSTSRVTARQYLPSCFICRSLFFCLGIYLAIVSSLIAHGYDRRCACTAIVAFEQSEEKSYGTSSSCMRPLKTTPNIFMNLFFPSSAYSSEWFYRSGKSSASRECAETISCRNACICAV